MNQPEAETPMTRVKNPPEQRNFSFMDDSPADDFSLFDPIRSQISPEISLSSRWRWRPRYAPRAQTSREAVLDWDYHSRVREVANIIHTKQYREFRQTGIAFEFGDAWYDAPNRSCASYAEATMKSGRDRGHKKDVRGYWLDVLVGPHVAFGVEIDGGGGAEGKKGRDNCERDLFRIVNEGTGSAQQRHHTVEVAMYNVLGYMWSVEVRRRRARSRVSHRSKHSYLVVLIIAAPLHIPSLHRSDSFRTGLPTK